MAALRYFVALRQRELAEGKLKLRRQHNKAGAPVPGPGQKGARNQVRVLEGLAASGLRAIRYALEARRPLAGRMAGNTDPKPPPDPNPPQEPPGCAPSALRWRRASLV